MERLRHYFTFIVESIFLIIVTIVLFPVRLLGLLERKARI